MPAMAEPMPHRLQRNRAEFFELYRVVQAVSWDFPRVTHFRDSATRKMTGVATRTGEKWRRPIVFPTPALSGSGTTGSRRRDLSSIHKDRAPRQDGLQCTGRHYRLTTT